MTLQVLHFSHAGMLSKLTPREFTVQELVNTQQLVDAKKNETTTEEHLQVEICITFHKSLQSLDYLDLFCVSSNCFHILVMRPLPIGSMAAREILLEAAQSRHFREWQSAC